MTTTFAFGRGRVWIGVGGRVSPAASDQRSAPRPTTPRQTSPSAGAVMMPRIGTPLGHQRDIDRIFVAAGDEFPRAVERIDQEIAAALDRLFGLSCAACSSEMIGTREQAVQPSQMTASAASSAAVTGEPSALVRIAGPGQSKIASRGARADAGQLVHERAHAAASKAWHGRFLGFPAA